ncbi:hypothetical protein ASG29_06670 [Sphingomonas sp. Leaf412]|uniref:hypothetical protein n=1 Tax=Sphingomonas sp. Leaf412 TaxID=1736370 RepID=UPI0006F6514B|nr:hypothetical protein [Sphingomonas sp. Leaf412]KQT33690.1 hypothetical protein ASG29_06670 [Sphingomonas sp. Leaf412]
MKKIDVRVSQKFALAASILMTRVFSTDLRPNRRRLMLACGPAMPGKKIAMPNPDMKFDVLGFGFRPGKEWKGPSEIFVEEMRDGELRIWPNCRLYASTATGPLYVLTDDPEVSFTYDGNSLVALLGRPDDHAEGALRAKALLREAARQLPEDIEQQTMM